VQFERLGKGDSKITLMYEHGERGSSLPILHSNVCSRDFALHGSGQKLELLASDNSECMMLKDYCRALDTQGHAKTSHGIVLHLRQPCYDVDVENIGD